MQASKQFKCTRLINATAVGTTTLTPAAPVDMQGFEGVLFIVHFGAITDGTPNLKARQGQLANMSDAADLAGTDAAAADTDDNKILFLDIVNPTERYVDCQIVRGGATGCVVDSVTAVQYGPRKLPTTQDSTVSTASEAHRGPAEGTA